MRRPEQDRLARLRQLMSENKLDSLLVTRREDVRYLTGFTGSAGSLLVSSGRPCLITDFRYKLQARKETTGVAILIQKKDHFTALRDAGERMGVDTLWFDESSLTIEGLKKSEKTGTSAQGTPGPGRELRQRKDRHELANIRMAIRRAEESFRELKRCIKPGATERELGSQARISDAGQRGPQGGF